MLGIRGEEEEQPARRSARPKSVKNSLESGLRGRLTKENDCYSNEDHQDVVIAQKRQNPWSKTSATTSFKARL